MKCFIIFAFVLLAMHQFVDAEEENFAVMMGNALGSITPEKMKNSVETCLKKCEKNKKGKIKSSCKTRCIEDCKKDFKSNKNKEIYCPAASSYACAAKSLC